MIKILTIHTDCGKACTPSGCPGNHDTGIACGIEINGIVLMPESCRDEYPFDDRPRQRDLFVRTLIAIRAELSKRTDLVPDTTIPQYADEEVKP